MSALIEIKDFNLNKFWINTPTPLKYLLVISLLIATIYFLFMKQIYYNKTAELNKMVEQSKITYELVNKFENFRITQEEYNGEMLKYINNLYILVQELNNNTNQQFGILINSNSDNKDDIIKKIALLNQSFEKLTKIYQEVYNTQTIQRSQQTNNYKISVKQINE